MLTKDLLRVSRAGGGYRPQFADGGDRGLAARAIGVFQGHVGEPRSALDDALDDLEAEAADFKLVRGFAKLLERGATFETVAPVEPAKAREAAFAVAEDVGVVTRSERDDAVAAAAAAVAVEPAALDASLFADLDERQVLVDFDPPGSPADLVARYNLALAQTALFDAVEVRIRSDDPRALVGAVKRLRLMYEVERTDGGRVVIVTGPDALFRASRRYGTRFARLLRSVVAATGWRLEATIDDRGTERTMVLSDADPLRVPGDDGSDPEPSYDSGVEADFATRFAALDLDWTLVREPEPLAAGASVMIPDFAFDYDHADFRVYFEIMGFWTPDYVAKKLDRLDAVEAAELLVAVDESLGVAPEIELRDHRAIPYHDRVSLRDVRAVLRDYEAGLVAEAAASLPDALRPEEDVVELRTLADELGVSEDALDWVDFPDHRTVGRTLVRPGVLEAVADALEPGMSLDEAAGVLADHRLGDASATLSALGYRVDWSDLGGGRLERRE